MAMYKCSKDAFQLVLDVYRSRSVRDILTSHRVEMDAYKLPLEDWQVFTVHRDWTASMTDYIMLYQYMRNVPMTRNMAIHDTRDPSGVAPMTPVQQANVAWMKHVEDTLSMPIMPHIGPDSYMHLLDRTTRRSGGLLMDRTGLGKTRSMLELIRLYKQSGSAGPTLVLAPASIVVQWKNECAKWVPDLRVLFMYGPSAKKRTDPFESYDIVITTPQTMQRHTVKPCLYSYCGGMHLYLDASIESSLAEVGWDAGQPEAVLTTSPNISAYMEFAHSYRDASIVDAAAKCARLAYSHSMKITYVKQSSADCITPDINYTPFKVASAYDCAYVWHRMPFEGDTDLCYCKASGVEKGVIKSMMLSAKELFNDDSHLSKCRTSQQWGNFVREQIRSGCDCCALDSSQLDLRACPCTFQVSRRSQDVMAIYASRALIRRWFLGAYYYDSYFVNRQMYRIMFTMLSRCAKMWYKMFAAYEWIHCYRMPTAHLFPRTGLHVLMRHAAPCGLFGFPSHSTYRLDSRERCKVEVKPFDICHNCQSFGNTTVEARVYSLRDYWQREAPMRLVHWNRLVMDEYHSIGKSEQFAQLFYRNAWLISATIPLTVPSLAFIGRTFLSMPLVYKIHPSHFSLNQETDGSVMLDLMRERMQGSQDYPPCEMNIVRVTTGAECRHISLTESDIDRIQSSFRNTTEFEQVVSHWFNSVVQNVPMDVRAFCAQKAARGRMWGEIARRAFNVMVARTSENEQPSRVQYKDLLEKEPGDVAFFEPSCSICLDDLTDPCIVTCRHVFCYECILQWSTVSGRCPKCRQDLLKSRQIYLWRRMPKERDDQIAETPASSSSPASSSTPALSSQLQAASPVESAETPASSSTMEASSLPASLSQLQAASLPKIDWLAGFCQERSSEPIIVFVNGSTEFVAHELQRRGIQAVAMTSSMSGTRRGRIIRLLETGRIKVLCLKYQCHSSGIDLCRVKTMVCLTPDAKTHNMIQAIGRVTRLGGQGSVSIYLVSHASSTIEPMYYDKISYQLSAMAHYSVDEEENVYTRPARSWRAVRSYSRQIRQRLSEPVAEDERAFSFEEETGSSSPESVSDEAARPAMEHYDLTDVDEASRRLILSILEREYGPGARDG